MLQIPDALSPDSTDFWRRLCTAIACGGTIGLERQLRGKASGIRTSILICLGTMVFVALGATAANADPTRVLGQVVTGIGFLGAGVILIRQGRILGVTTAAVIWVTAAIGCVIGFGYLKTALILTALTIAIIIGVEVLEELLERRLHSRIRERENVSPRTRTRKWGRRSGDVRQIPDDDAGHAR